MKKNYPKISIVTPNYNCDKFLEETIKSIINQNYPNLEYIIIDGGSNDKSVEIIKKYEKYISYWISEKDSGMYEAIQKGFNKSTGDIMAWLNADDKYHDKCLYSIANIFKNNSIVNWVTGINVVFNENGETTHVEQSFQHNRFSQFINPFNYIQQESTFWRRKLWEQAGSFINTQLKYASDFELWLRFNRYEQIYLVDCLIGGFRFRENQISRKYIKEYKAEVLSSLKKEEDYYLSIEEKNTLNKIKNLLQLKNRNDSIIKSEEIKNKISELSKQKPKIGYNYTNNRYQIKGETLHLLLENMKKRRENKKSFLDFIKNKFKYYPDLIIDVGVAKGTPELYETFPESKMILFEPLIEFEKDIKSLKTKYKYMHYENCALGNEENTIQINVHPDLDGSSIYLENEDSSLNGLPRNVNLKTLDSFIQKYDFEDKSIILKVDVQGAEIDVLRGSIKSLNNVDIVILECTFFNFFNNNSEFIDVINFMNTYNFVVYDIFDFLYRPLDNALSQVDIAFVKKDSIFRKEHIFATKEQRKILSKNTSVNIIKKPENKQSKNSSNLKFSIQFNKLINFIEQIKYSKYSYVLYGYGTIGKMIESLIPDKIITYVDKNIENKNPSSLKNMKFDKILITVLGREKEITNYLIDEISINKDQITIIELE